MDEKWEQGSCSHLVARHVSLVTCHYLGVGWLLRVSAGEEPHRNRQRVFICVAGSDRAHGILSPPPTLPLSAGLPQARHGAINTVGRYSPRPLWVRIQQKNSQAR